MSGILFSCGVLYFNFSAVSAVNDYISLINRAFSYIGQPPFVSPWIMLFGFLILGISGIIALVIACLHLALSAKQLSKRLEAPKAPEVAPPRSVANVKYCTKCGASMSLDSVYCPKCGQKHPEA
jgi:ribosomal protein L40E